MEGTTPEKPKMRFLAFANNEEDAEKEAKLKEAAAKIEQAMAKEKVLSELIDYKEEHQKEQQIDPANDTRSLYERLEEQRNKKKEDLEAAQKLSNWIIQLDDDDVEYLNEVAKKKQEDELRRRLEIHDTLEAKKRLDEQKMLAEEQKMKDILLGKSSQTTKPKSRLSSLIKMKPKVKKDDPCGQPGTSSTVNQGDGSSDSKALPAASTTTNQSQRTPPGQSATNSSSDRAHDSHGIPECTCPRNIMTSIGVLPSLPIIKKAHDSSDQESDCSDDDLYGRLVPRTRKRRK